MTDGAGEPTLMQVKGDEMAQRRGDKKHEAKTKAQAAAPSTNTKRRTLKFAKEIQLWVSKFFPDGKNTGMYPNQPDVTVGDLMGIEVKHKPLPKWIGNAFSQARGANEGTGRLSAVVIVDKDQQRGAGVRRDAWLIISLHDWDTLVERVQDDGD